MSDQNKSKSREPSVEDLKKRQYVDSVMLQMKSEGKRFTSDDYFDYKEHVLFYCTESSRFAVEQTDTLMGGWETFFVTETAMRDYILTVRFVYPEDDPDSHLNRRHHGATVEFRRTQKINALKAAAPPSFALRTAQWEVIRQGYSEPHRHYHTLDHLCAMAQHFTQVAKEPGWAYPREAYAALLFHDLVYDPARADNEARSAERMREVLSSSDGADLLGVSLDRVAHLVELTALHGQQLPNELSDDEALFLDIDMSILGSPEPVYLNYEAQIEAEYLPVYPGPLFRLGRAEFLRKTLAAGPLFLSPLFHERFEELAQRNMRAALARLEAIGPGT